MTVPVVTDEQRRARLAVRHRLTPDTAGRSPADAADAVLALHATDPASVYLSAVARGDGTAAEDVEEALYVRRSVVRMLGMRRTVFVTPADLAPVVHAACTKAIAAKERAKLLEFVTQTGFTASPQRWLRRVERAALDALRARGEATAAELTEDVPELGRKILVGSGKWQAEQSAATRVLFLLAADGETVRGRPKGSWLSTQYRWASADAWLPTGPLPDLDAAAARRALARRWLWSYGPGTEADLKWWTGWTLTQTRKALAELDGVEVELSNGTGLLLADDLEPVTVPAPSVALLPALDPTPMGWTGRDWFLGPHRDALFDRSGNVGPTVWHGGRIVGGWAHHPSGEVVVRLLEDIGTDATDAVHDAADTLRTWLGPARVTPRFRTPLERELTAGRDTAGEEQLDR